MKALDADGQSTFANLSVDYDPWGGTWEFTGNADTRVQMDYNTVSTGLGTSAIGGTGTDFIELGSQAAVTRTSQWVMLAATLRCR